MGLCCLYSNQCAYANCGLHFANQYDLIAHVEFTHIPVIEAEMKRKADEAIARGEAPTTSTNMPLSCVSKVFRKAYNPKPIKYEGIKVSFNHYKKRPVSESVRRQQEQMRQLQDQIDPFDNRKVGDIDFSECQPEDPEMRFLCSSQQCIKRYKNIYALKAHMNSAHQLVLEETISGGPGPSPAAQEMMAPPPEPIEKPFLAPAPVALVAQAPPVPVRAPVVTQKCPYCSRRYKTDIGLKNHLIQVHQKADPPEEPSQEVLDQLINQAKAQGQKERMQQYAQSQMLRGSLLPTRQMKVALDVKTVAQQRVQQQLSSVKLLPLTTTSQSLKQSALPVQQKQLPRSAQTYQIQYQSLPPQRQPVTQMPQLKRMTPIKLFQPAPQQQKYIQQTVVRQVQYQSSECQPSTSTATNYYEQLTQPTNSSNQSNQNQDNQQ